MANMRRSFAAALVIAACSGGGSQSSPDPGPAVVPNDHGSASGETVQGQNAKSTSAPVRAAPDAVRAAPPIGIHLRSSPPGARVAVDGASVGTTPTFWSGVADGRAHAFTFTLVDHQVAHYRFVPVTGGIVHARLVPRDERGRAAGVSPSLGR